MAKGLFDLSGKVAVVTGGNSGIGLGFARGIAHIALLEAIDELGLRVTAVSGCSMGAIVGAAYASGLTGADLLTPAVNTDKWIQTATWYQSIFNGGVAPRNIAAEQSNDIFRNGDAAFFCSRDVCGRVSGYCANPVQRYPQNPRPLSRRCPLFTRRRRTPRRHRSRRIVAPAAQILIVAISAKRSAISLHHNTCLLSASAETCSRDRFSDRGV